MRLLLHYYQNGFKDAMRGIPPWCGNWEFEDDEDVYNTGYDAGLRQLSRGNRKTSVPRSCPRHTLWKASIEL